MNRSLVFAFVPLDGNTKRAEEMYILRRERLAPFLRLLASGLRWPDHRFRLLLQLVETDGCFEHQQDVEPLLADVLHNTGNVLRFGDGLVDCFSQLLNEFSQLGVQDLSPFPPCQ